MEIETVLGRTNYLDKFDKSIKEKIAELRDKNEIIDVNVTSGDRLVYGVIKYKKRVTRSKAPKTSNTGAKGTATK